MTIAPSESWTIAPVNLNEAGVGKRLAQRRSVGKAGGILGSGQQDRQESEWNCNQPTLHLIIRLLDYISTPSSASQFHRFALVWPVR